MSGIILNDQNSHIIDIIIQSFTDNKNIPKTIYHIKQNPCFIWRYQFLFKLIHTLSSLQYIKCYKKIKLHLYSDLMENSPFLYITSPLMYIYIHTKHLTDLFAMNRCGHLSVGMLWTLFCIHLNVWMQTLPCMC